MKIMSFSALTIIFTFLTSNQYVTGDGENINHAEQLYMQLFKRRRAEQLAAVKTFRNTPYEKQTSLVNMIAKKLFTVIEDSRVMLEASDYIPGNSPFPQNEDLRDALSNILENVSLFGEIVLRFPDIVDKVFKDNNEYSVLYKWGVSFVNLNHNLLDSATVKLITMVSQELNYTDRMLDFVNPYRKTIVKRDLNKELSPKIAPKKKKHKVIKKGPRLSSFLHSEL